MLSYWWGSDDRDGNGGMKFFRQILLGSGNCGNQKHLVLDRHLCGHIWSVLRGVIIFFAFLLYFFSSIFSSFVWFFCEQGNCTWRWIDTCGHIWSVLRGVKPKPSAFLFKNPPIDPFLHRVRLSLMSPNRRGWSIFNPRATFIQSFRRQCHILQTTKSSLPPLPLRTFPCPLSLISICPNFAKLKSFSTWFSHHDTFHSKRWRPPTYLQHTNTTSSPNYSGGLLSNKCQNEMLQMLHEIRTGLISGHILSFV